METVEASSVRPIKMYPIAACGVDQSSFAIVRHAIGGRGKGNIFLQPSIGGHVVDDRRAAFGEVMVLCALANDRQQKSRGRVVDFDFPTIRCLNLTALSTVALAVNGQHHR